jgi:membrane protein implicated in regulation of membrane protease activity
LAAIRFLTCWGNAPFAIAAGVAVLFVLLQVTGLLGLLAGGEDADANHNVDHDVDHDVDADADADGESDHDADHDHDSGGRGWGEMGVALLGVGKIPLSVIWQTYAIVFAMTGFGINWHYLGSGASPPAYSLVLSLPASLVAGYAAVAVVARVLGPVLSSKEQEATSRGQLVGQIGVVISSRVDQEFGEVRIRDRTGHDLRVICKLPKGVSKPVAEHRQVVVVDYEAERGEWLVEPLEDDDSAEDGRKVS